MVVQKKRAHKQCDPAFFCACINISTKTTQAAQFCASDIFTLLKKLRVRMKYSIYILCARTHKKENSTKNFINDTTLVHFIEQQRQKNDVYLHKIF